MSLGDTIRSGVRWVVFGKLSHQALHFAVSIVLARLLVPADFGLLLTVQVFTGFAGLVASGGMGQALVQARSIELRDTRAVFTAQLAIGIALFLFFVSVSPWFAAWYDEPVYRDLLRVSALTFLLRPFANVPASLLHRAMRYRAKAFIDLATLAVASLASISLALLGYGVWSLVTGGIAGGITNAVLTCAVAGWYPCPAVSRRAWRRFGSYGIKVSGIDFVVYLRGRTPIFIISRFLGPGAVGLFNKASSLNELPSTIVSSPTYKVVFRALSSTQENRDRSKYIYLRTITLVTVYGLPFYVGLWWLAEPFIVTLYGSKWAGAAPVLEILAVAGALIAIEMQSGAVCAARRLLGKEFAVQAGTWLVLIAACAVGYRWGITGIAWAIIPGSALRTALMARLACRDLHVRGGELMAALSPALRLNAILVAALGLAQATLPPALESDHPAVYLVIMGAVGGLVYAGCFLFLPISRLESESMRWRQWLRLGVNGPLTR